MNIFYIASASDFPDEAEEGEAPTTDSWDIWNYFIAVSDKNFIPRVGDKGFLVPYNGDCMFIELLEPENFENLPFALKDLPSSGQRFFITSIFSAKQI